jgi:flagellar hook-length control protein FliK
MNNLSNLEFLPSLPGTNTSGSINKGNSDGGLFHSILSKINGSQSEGEWGTSLYAGTGSQKRSLLQMNQAAGTDEVQGLKKKMRDLCISSSELIIPESALQQLTHLLKNQGFSLQKINNMINLSRNTDGLIQLDRLLSQINGNMNNAKTGTASVIEPAFVPGVEEMLFKMGLGAGDVKSTIENCVNTRGEIEISKLSAALGKFFPEAGSESELLNFLSINNIKIKPQIDHETLLNLDLKKQLADIPVSSSQDFLKHVKQNIASLLREKGIPAQEVKSFLETFSLDMTKTTKKEANEQRSDIPLTRINVNDLISPRGNSWNERILGILKNERIIIADQFNKDSVAGKIELKLDVNELLKQGNQKISLDQLLQVAGKSNGDKVAGFDVKKVSQDKQARFINVKDAMGSDSMALKTENETRSMGTTARSGEVLNLPQPLPKILDRMFWMIRSGEQRSRIFINPPELGRLDLNLSIKDGHLQANLNAENVLVKEIIEENLNQLKQQLNSQGLTVDRFDVMVGLDNERSREDNLWAGRNQKRSNPGKNGINISAEVPEEGSLKKSIINDSQVDIHV